MEDLQILQCFRIPETLGVVLLGTIDLIDVINSRVGRNVGDFQVSLEAFDR